MKIIYVFFSTLFLYNCTHINEDIENTVDSSSKNAQIEMKKDLMGIRKKIDSVYFQAINNNDSSAKVKLKNFYQVLVQTTKYIDSVNNDLANYDNQDLRNNKLIKEKFVESTLGDTIFGKLKTTFYLAESVPINRLKKDSINQISKNVLNNFNVVAWKNSFFGLNSPSGTIMVIYGFEYELFKASMISIR
jgi:hypothetical protein